MNNCWYLQWFTLSQKIIWISAYKPYHDWSRCNGISLFSLYPIFVQPDIYYCIRSSQDSFFFFFCVAVKPFCAPLAYWYTISGAGVVSGTPHPAVWDMHISSSQFAQSVDCRLVQAYKTPTVVGKVCFVTSSESGLSPLDIVCTP